MDVKNINASLDTQYIGWECPKFDYMQTNPRHKNECDYSLMLQDMIQKKKKKQFLCDEFCFSLEKLDMWWVTNNFILCPYWSRYK